MIRLRERPSELAASGGRLVADLDRVNFIDSAGPVGLVGAAKRATAHGGSQQVACPSPKTASCSGWPGWTVGPLARTLDEALAATAGTRTTAPPQPLRLPPASVLGLGTMRYGIVTTDRPTCRNDFRTFRS